MVAGNKQPVGCPRTNTEETSPRAEFGSLYWSNATAGIITSGSGEAYCWGIDHPALLFHTEYQRFLFTSAQTAITLPWASAETPMRYCAGRRAGWKYS